MIEAGLLLVVLLTGGKALLVLVGVLLVVEFIRQMFD